MRRADSSTTIASEVGEESEAPLSIEVDTAHRRARSGLADLESFTPLDHGSFSS
jgi:hypothetical protein